MAYLKKKKERPCPLCGKPVDVYDHEAKAEVCHRQCMEDKVKEKRDVRNQDN